MTTPVVPELIFNLFKNEIIKINLTLLTSICSLYNIDVEEAKNRLKKELNLDLEIDKLLKIQIVKKQKEVNKEERCIARIYRPKDIEVSQCHRKMIDGCDFCKRHKKMSDEGRLKYGTIHTAVPKEISSPILNKKKKVALL